MRLYLNVAKSQNKIMSAMPRAAVRIALFAKRLATHEIFDKIVEFNIFGKFKSIQMNKYIYVYFDIDSFEVYSKLKRLLWCQSSGRQTDH